MKHQLLIVFCLALIVPAIAASPQTNASIRTSETPLLAASVCSADADRQREPVNPEYVWRLRAYQHLDCVVSVLDEALKTEGDAIMLSREEAEQVRAAALWAKDAAARIGR